MPSVEVKVDVSPTLLTVDHVPVISVPSRAVPVPLMVTVAVGVVLLPLYVTAETV